MASREEDRDRTRRKRKSFCRQIMMACIPILLVCVVLEVVAWIVDLQVGFHAKLREAHELMNVANQPLAVSDRLQLENPWLAVRKPTNQWYGGGPYRVGGVTIPDANPSHANVLLHPSQLEPNAKHRVFILGGSAAFGFPYQYTDTFAYKLAKGVESRGESCHVINASHSGAASAELVFLAERIVNQFDPSMLVIFAGNNEWIHWLPDYQQHVGPSRLAMLRMLSTSRALAAVQFWSMKWSARRREADDNEQFATTNSGGPDQSHTAEAFQLHHELFGYNYAIKYLMDDDQFDPSSWLRSKKEFLDAYEANLTRLIQFARSKGVDVVLLTVPFNYKLSPVWKHPQPITFNSAHQTAIRAKLDAATTIMNNGKFEQALAIADEALALDESSPVVLYVRAFCLEQMQRLQEAEEAYAQCREHMVGNLGSRLSVNACIRRLAEKLDVKLVDVCKIFDDHEHANSHFFNETLIHDDCHPTPSGHQLIADALLKQL